MTEVIQQLNSRFVPDVAMVKKRIESLIERIFLGFFFCKCYTLATVLVVKLATRESYFVLGTICKMIIFN